MQVLHQPDQAARWLAERVSGQLRTDSRGVQDGDGFIAWPGAATDGRRYVDAARAQGARACLVEAEGLQAFDLEPADDLAAYPGLKAATGPIAAIWNRDPSQALDVIAVTGTNGKTSTTWWLAQALSALGPSHACGLVGTLGIGRPPVVVANGLTTPDPVLLQHHFRQFVDDGLRACAIEASSIGIAEQRLAGTRIRVAVFTNFTRDHLDYHGSMQAYWDAKAALFDWPGLQAAVINVDDARGAELAGRLAGGATALDVWTLSCERPARLSATDVRQGERGLVFEVHEGLTTVTLHTHLIGTYNVANLLGVLGTLRALGVPLAEAARACDGLMPVPGRMDCVGEPGEPLVVVDYAHTPDAIEKALQALHSLARSRGGRLWCVFGCGGDRDPSKRPLMGGIAQAGADRVLVTSDNPRSESPQTIIDQILAGLSDPAAVEVEPDRAAAIARAVAEADAGDVVLVAGKGHEDYQEIAGVRRPFSDRGQAIEALRRRRQTAAGTGGTREGAR